MAASLFTLDELAQFMRLPADEVNAESAALFMDLTAEEILGVTGTAPTDPRAKGLALNVCARAYRAANEKISETIDDYTYRLKGENFQQDTAVELTAAERRRLRRWAGLLPSGSIKLIDPRWRK